MSRGLQFQASYNFAKNLSDEGGYAPGGFAGSGGGTTTNFFNPRLDYGNVAFTRRQRFQTTFLYESPFSHTGNRLINQAAGGWELAGVLMFQTGPFLTVLANGADPPVRISSTSLATAARTSSPEPATSPLTNPSRSGLTLLPTPFPQTTSAGSGIRPWAP